MSTSNNKNIWSFWHRGRVVKAIDSKSIGVPPRRFESCRCRFIFIDLLNLILLLLMIHWMMMMIIDESNQSSNEDWFDFRFFYVLYSMSSRTWRIFEKTFILFTGYARDERASTCFVSGLIDTFQDGTKKSSTVLRYVEIARTHVNSLSLAKSSPATDSTFPETLTTPDTPSIPDAGLAQIVAFVATLELGAMKDIEGTGNESFGNFRNGSLDFGVKCLYFSTKYCRLAS